MRPTYLLGVLYSYCMYSYYNLLQYNYDDYYNIDDSLGWLRQEDNQYLSCPPEIAKDLDPKLQALLGYTAAGPSLGYFTPPLPAGRDLSAPERALRRPTKPVRLDADGRIGFVED